MAAVFANKSFTINDWRVDPELNRLSRANEVVKIDPQNMKVLELLASRPGEVVSQAEIEQSAWEGVIVTPNSVYQSIAQLRRALGDSRSDPRYIETIARRGYRCVADVRTGESVSDEMPVETLTGAVEPDRAWAKRARTFLLIVLLIGIACTTAWHSYFGSQEAFPTPFASFEISSPVARVDLEIELGDAAATARQPQQALRHYQTALREAREALSSPTLVAEILTKASRIHLGLDEESKALELSREAVEILRDSAPPLHPGFIEAYAIEGEALTTMTRYREAQISLERAIALAEQLYGPTHPRTLYVRGSLTLVHMGEGRWHEAEQMTRRLLLDFGKAWGSEEEESTAYFTTSLAWSLYYQGRYPEAELEAREAVRILEKVGSPLDPHLAAANQVLADTLVKLGDYSDAEAASRRCMSILTKTDARPWRIARAASTLGEALLHIGMHSEAEEKLTYAAALLDERGSDLERRAANENARRLLLLKAKKLNSGS